MKGSNHQACDRVRVRPSGDRSLFLSIENGYGEQPARFLKAAQDNLPHSSRLLGISKCGDPYLRTLLIHGVRSVVYRAKAETDKRSLWIVDKQQRLGSTKTCVAVANKNALIVWSLIAREEEYRHAA